MHDHDATGVTSIANLKDLNVTENIPLAYC